MRYSWLILLLFFPVYNLMMTKVHIVKAIEQKSLDDHMNIKAMDGVQISGFNGWVSHWDREKKSWESFEWVV